jgi:hypothetical protein
MKHQGQTMSETMSMVGVGLTRCSFLLVAPVMCPGAGCELQDWGIIPS